MLGIIGFLALGILAILYAYTFSINFKLVPVREKRLFASAFGLLGMCAFIWMGTFFVNESFVNELVYLTDVLLVIATGCMLAIFVDISRPIIFTLVTTLGATLLALRAYAVPSEAYISNGILNFNLPREVAFGFGLLFLIIWLPANIKIVEMALRNSTLRIYKNSVHVLFISNVLMACLFLSAQREIMIIITFVSITVLFLLLSISNILIGKIDSKSLKKELAKHE